MNELLEKPINFEDKKRISKTFWIFLSLCFLLPVFVNTAVLNPLYGVLSANAVLRNSAFLIAVKYLQDILDIFAFSSAYALVIFSSLLLDKKYRRFTLLFYTAVFFSQIPLKLVINAVMYGSFGSVADIIVDVVYLLVYFILYMLQFSVVYVIAATDSSRYIRHAAYLKDKGRGNSRGFASGNVKVLPFKKFVDWYNPLQRSAVKASAFIAGIRIGMRIVNDVIFGAPTSFGEVMVMALYYVSDLLYGILAYAAMVLIIKSVYRHLTSQNAKKAENADSSDNNVTDRN